MHSSFTEVAAFPGMPSVPAFPTLPALPFMPRYGAGMGGMGGRPAAPAYAYAAASPMMARNPYPMPNPMGPMGAATPAAPSKPLSIPPPLIMGLMMPMTAVLSGTGPRHGEPDPFAAVNVVNMMKAAVPDDASTEEKALAYGNIIAGMGGVKGLRGSTLKRLQGCTQSLMYGGERFLKSGIWGDTS